MDEWVGFQNLNGSDRHRLWSGQKKIGQINPDMDIVGI